MSLRSARPAVAAVALASSVAVAACGGASGASAPTAPTSPTSPSIPGGVCSVLGGTARLTQGIVNGTTCSADASPIAKLNLADASGQTVATCSGTVIAPRAVLTAAHCLAGDTASLQVFFGTGGTQFPAASFHYYPGYNENDPTTHDVGVVLFDQDLPRTPVPLLLSRDAAVGELAVIAGWGSDQTGSGTILPRAGTTTIASVDATTIRTEYSPSMSAVCSGDSGGPLLVSQGGVWSIAGITSAVSVGGACTMGTNYFIRVRNADVSAFIRKYVPDAARQ
jgi:V8-like Glu-specific endopeptidase